jgi:hypothetical protein
MRQALAFLIVAASVGVSAWTLMYPAEPTGCIQAPHGDFIGEAKRCLN